MYKYETVCVTSIWQHKGCVPRKLLQSDNVVPTEPQWIYPSSKFSAQWRREGRFSRAAEKFFRTQSAVSQTIRKLEEEARRVTLRSFIAGRCAD